MWYGNKTSDAGLDGEDAANVWDANFVGVWHLEESSGVAVESTSNSNNGSFNGNIPDAVPGIVGNSQDCDGRDDFVSVLDNSDFDFADEFTWSMWMNPDAVDADGRHQRYDKTSKDGYMLWQDDTGSGMWRFSVFVNPSFDTINSDSPPSGNWQYVIGVRNSTGTLQLYVDGVVQADSGVVSGAIDSSGALRFGTSYDGSVDYSGLMDETRVSKIARSDAWIKFEYYNMNSSDNELTFGAENDDTTADTSFTVSFPIDTDRILFNGSNHTEPDFQPQNQTSVTPILTITNTGDTTLNISFYINGSLPAGFFLKADTDNAVAGAKEITTTSQEIASGLASAGEEEIWLWGNYSYQTPQTVNSKLNVSVEEHV